MTTYKTTRFIVGAPLGVTDACGVAAERTPPDKLREKEDRAIRKALRILEGRFWRGPVMSSTVFVKDYLRLQFAEESRELFSAVWLDNLNRALGLEVLAVGTITGAPVYLRDLVSSALERGAAKAIIVHNHPSGLAEPSQPDIDVTPKLARALDLIQVKLLDHLIVSATGAYSFAENMPEVLDQALEPGASRA